MIFLLVYATLTLMYYSTVFLRHILQIRERAKRGLVGTTAPFLILISTHFLLSYLLVQ